MKRLVFHSSVVPALVLAGLLNCSLATAQETEATPRNQEYSSFRIVTERNIFNANRSGRSPRGNRETPRPSRVDAFALLGTMSYDNGRVAFFDGSGSEYRKDLKRQGRIAEFTVLDIGWDRVKLEGHGKHFDLRVGSQLRREDGGEWKIAEGSDLPRGRGGRSSETASASASGGGGETTTSSGAGSSGGGGGGGDMSEVLKRLLEQRERETR